MQVRKRMFSCGRALDYLLGLQWKKINATLSNICDVVLLLMMNVVILAPEL